MDGRSALGVIQPRFYTLRLYGEVPELANWSSLLRKEAQVTWVRIPSSPPYQKLA